MTFTSECVTKAVTKTTPDHYDINGHKCIDIAEQFNFNLGNVIKYVWRAGRKAGETKLEDLQKAKWYIEREIEREKEDK